MRLNKTKRRQSKGRKNYGGRVATNLELINTSNNENMDVDENDNYNNTLLGLGFDEGDIEMMEGMGMDLETIKMKYRNALISTGDDGYGLIELREIPFEDIINASDLNILTNTTMTKHRVANLVVHNVIAEEEARRRNANGGRNARRSRKSKRSKKSKRTKKSRKLTK